jgi:hypothetical protein
MLSFLVISVADQGPLIMMVVNLASSSSSNVRLYDIFCIRLLTMTIKPSYTLINMLIISSCFVL